MTTYRAAVIGLGRMGSTFDDEMSEGGSIFLPYCHAPRTALRPIRNWWPEPTRTTNNAPFWRPLGLEQDHLYGDYRQMLERENLDLVSVCTTARIRSQIVQDCARAGVKAVWAEKPIALTLAEAVPWSRPAANTARPWLSTAPAAGTRSSVRLATSSTKAN